MKISANQYAKTLYELTAGKSQPEIDVAVSGLAEVLQKKNQLRLMPKIIKKIDEIWNKEIGIVEAEIISARKLERDQILKIENYLKEKYEAKEILINNIVNESLKGGVIIRVGDEVLDGSVERSLRDLKKSLVL